MTADSPNSEENSGKPVSSYGQILRSTAFTGGASLISLAFSVVRTKVVALALGPAGVGILGTFTTLIGLSVTIFGLGIGGSGVRRIASAESEESPEKLAQSVWTIRRFSLLLGAAGAIALACASPFVSKLTFGSAEHAPAIALLSFAVLFGIASEGHASIIQGARRIRDLSKLTIVSAAVSTLLGVPLVYWFGLDGVVPMLILVPAFTFFLARKFAKQVGGSDGALPRKEFTREARSLLHLGSVFMASAIMTAAVAYLVRMLIIRSLGIEAAGYYSAAFAISGIYSSFILQAMGADFFPRLTSFAADPAAVNRLVNEQTEVALLLATPGLLATLVFSPWVISIFYSGEFDAAGEILRWQVIGLLFKIISWPMAFIQLARGRNISFLVTEVIANLSHFTFVFIGIKVAGLPGTGIGFTAMYGLYTVMIFGVAAMDTGFRWNGGSLKILAWAVLAVLVVFVSNFFLSGPIYLVAGALLTCFVGVFCLRGLVHRTPAEFLRKIPFLARRL